MTVLRLLIVTSLLFTSLFHLAHTGHEQRVVRREISRLEDQVELARHRRDLQRARYQSTLFSILAGPETPPEAPPGFDPSQLTATPDDSSVRHAAFESESPWPGQTREREGSER